MSGPTFVCKTDRIGLTPLLIGGGPVFRRSDVLHEGLTRRCGREIANLFADPVASTDGRTISWYSEGGAGEPQPLASLDSEKRKGPEALLRTQLATLAPVLADPDLGALLSAALHVGWLNDILVLDGRPLITNWGFVPSDVPVGQPERLASHFASTLGRYAPFPAPSAGAPATMSTTVADAPAANDTPTESPEVMANPANSSAPETRERRRPEWWGLLIAVAVAAGVLLYLTLPHVLRSWYGSDYSSALQRAHELNDQLSTKIASIEKSLEDAVCVKGDLSGGGALPPGTPEQIKAPPGAGAPPGAAPVSNLADYLRNNVVMVWAQGPKGAGHGSGFFIGPHTIVTNYHVVEGATEIGVTNKALGRLTPVTVSAHTPGTIHEGADFAVLEVAADAVPPTVAPMALSPLGEQQQWIVVAGYPGVTTDVDARMARLKKGDLTAIPTQSQSTGTIMEVLPLPDQDPPLIAVNTPISHGNSGGPIVDQCGRVLGVATFEYGGVKELDYDKAYFGIGAAGLRAFLDSSNIPYTKGDEVCPGAVAAAPGANPPTGVPAGGAPGGSSPPGAGPPAVGLPIAQPAAPAAGGSR